MTNLEEIKFIVAQANEVIGRAKAIATSAPQYASIDDDQPLFLTIEDPDTAILQWTTAESGYYGAIERESHRVQIDANLLSMTFPEIHAWAAQQERIYKEKVKRDREIEAIAIAQRQELHERTQLAALKKKYEGTV